MCVRLYKRCISKNRNDTVYHHADHPNQLRTSIWRPGVRHIQCSMVCLGVAAAFVLKVNLSVAIVSMTRKSSSSPDIPVLAWSEPMKGAVQSAMFWTICLFLIPSGQLTEKFGPKVCLTTSLFSGGLVSILTPLAAIYGGFNWTIFIRVLQGVTQAFAFPCANCFVSKWAPKSERGRLFTWIFNGVELGIIIGMALAGVLADSRWGWPSIFYVSGALAILWALVFWVVGADGPQHHKTISDSERDYILDSLANTSLERKTLKTPWKSILTSPLVWMLVITQCANLWGYMTLLTQIPSYLNAVFGVNMMKNGFLSSLPYVLNIILGLVFVAVDNFISNNNILSRLNTKRLWNTIGFWGPAFFLCLLAYSNQGVTFALILLTLAVGLNNAVFLGFLSNNLDLAPNFAGTLMGVTTAVANITSLLVPLFVGFVVTDPKSLLQWRVVFLTSAVSFFVGNVIYIAFCSLEVQPWNSPPEEQGPRKKFTHSPILTKQQDSLEAPKTN